MRVCITFLQNNSGFNQAYADEYHWGEDSESNKKHEWLTKLKVTGPVKAINFLKETTYQLSTPGDNGEALQYQIEHMTICECVLENDQLMTVGVSDSLLEKVAHPNIAAFQAKTGTNKTFHVYFYFKPGSQFVQPAEGIYIAKSDMPAAGLVNRDAIPR